MLDDEDEVPTFEPKTHTVWSIVAPLMDLSANIAGDVERMFKQYAVFVVQHALQKEYDRKFKVMTSGWDSSLGTGTVQSED
jgi:hypothetical protein